MPFILGPIAGRKSEEIPALSVGQALIHRVSPALCDTVAGAVLVGPLPRQPLLDIECGGREEGEFREGEVEVDCHPRGVSDGLDDIRHCAGLVGFVGGGDRAGHVVCCEGGAERERRSVGEEGHVVGVNVKEGGCVGPEAVGVLDGEGDCEAEFLGDVVGSVDAVDGSERAHEVRGNVVRDVG